MRYRKPITPLAYPLDTRGHGWAAWKLEHPWESDGHTFRVQKRHWDGEKHTNVGEPVKMTSAEIAAKERKGYGADASRLQPSYGPHMAPNDGENPFGGVYSVNHGYYGMSEDNVPTVNSVGQVEGQPRWAAEAGDGGWPSGPEGKAWADKVWGARGEINQAMKADPAWEDALTKRGLRIRVGTNPDGTMTVSNYDWPDKHPKLTIRPQTRSDMTAPTFRRALRQPLQTRAKYDAKAMAKLLDEGKAMKNPDGDPSYPIADAEDLHKAIHAVGRGKGDHAAIKAHIKKRAKALGMTDALPDDWSGDEGDRGDSPKFGSPEWQAKYGKGKAKKAAQDKVDGKGDDADDHGDDDSKDSGDDADASDDKPKFGTPAWQAKYGKKRSDWSMRAGEDIVITPPTGLAAVLTPLFADAVAFYLRAHGAHWNVVGPDFGEYHALFEKIYEESYEVVDPLAEILRKLGAMAPFQLGELDRLTTIPNAEVGRDALRLAADLLQANDALLAEYKAAFDAASAVDEQGICNFLAEQIDNHEMWRWQLAASLGMETPQRSADGTFRPVTDIPKFESWRKGGPLEFRTHGWAQWKLEHPYVPKPRKKGESAEEYDKRLRGGFTRWAGQAKKAGADAEDLRPEQERHNGILGGLRGGRFAEDVHGVDAKIVHEMSQNVKQNAKNMAGMVSPYESGRSEGLRLHAEHMTATQNDLDAHRKGVKDEADRAATHRFKAEDEAAKARDSKTAEEAHGHARAAADHADIAQDAADKTFQHAMGLNHKDAERGEHEDAMDRGDTASADAKAAKASAIEATRIAGEKSAAEVRPRDKAKFQEYHDQAYADTMRALNPPAPKPRAPALAAKKQAEKDAEWAHTAAPEHEASFRGTAAGIQKALDEHLAAQKEDIAKFPFDVKEATAVKPGDEITLHHPGWGATKDKTGMPVGSVQFPMKVTAVNAVDENTVKITGDNGVAHKIPSNTPVKVKRRLGG